MIPLDLVQTCFWSTVLTEDWLLGESGDDLNGTNEASRDDLSNIIRVVPGDDKSLVNTFVNRTKQTFINA